MFSDKLIDRINEKQNPTVLGLDPKLEYIPISIRLKNLELYGNTLKAASESIFEFNRRLMDAVADIIPAVKPQLAYYEMYGHEGLRALYRTMEYGREKGFIIIADGKRNDIGTTSGAYSSAYLGKTILEKGDASYAFNADALTVNGYLGTDGIKPMLEDCKNYDKGIFVLVKTSNPSSVQVQDMVLQDGRKVYELMADLVTKWGEDLIGKHGYSSVGAVVGATWPEQLKLLRNRMNSAYFLVPGYGAQGGSAKDVAVAFDKNGLGAVINASRSLMCAYRLERWKKDFSIEDFDLACREEAIRMREELKNEIG
ncbi:MAG: orotidine-5'-phosphate decarboxylase [Clostridiaceae bacterium]|nr:orotidine-5'-phosphate decarboxylase [Clostridiaceae bacterium]